MTISRSQRILALALAAILVAVAAAAQQNTTASNEGREGQQKADEKPAVALPRIPLQFQVIVSRYQGEKKISSLPYIVAANTNTVAATLRMGAQIPVVTANFPKAQDGKPTVFNYQTVGTNIDCQARTMSDGRFDVTVIIEESSVYQAPPGAPVPNTGDLAVLRTFKSSNTMILRDGQSRQFTAAADRVSGEVVKVDVTLTVVK